MDLLQQFQGVLGSLLLGGLFYFFFHLLNLLLDHRGIRFFWYLLQPVYFFSCTIAYYLFLCTFTYGIYNFFFTLSLLAGFLLYFFFYRNGVLSLMRPIASKIDSRLNGWSFKKTGIYLRWQKRKRKRREKREAKSEKRRIKKAKKEQKQTA